MSTIVTRAGKGSPLTWNEVDNNFTNLNTDKYQSGSNVSLGTIAGTTITSSALTSGRVTFASTGGLLADSANLTFNGTTLTATIMNISSSGATIPLEVQSSTGANAIRIKGRTSDGIGTVRFYESTSTTSYGIIQAASTYFTLGTEIATPITFQTNGTTRMTLDSSGNLGLGVTPNTWSLGKVVEINSGGNALWSAGPADIRLTAGAYYNGAYKYGNTGSNAAAYEIAGGTHVWRYAGGGTINNNITFTQAMTLDASGNLLVGTTSAGGVGGITVRPAIGGAGTYGRIDINQNQAADGMSFLLNGTQVGRILISTTTSYVTTSDYRLKENVAPMTGALAKIQALKPVTYNWKSDGSDGQGFIAHELAEVVPDCVVGEKDATREEEYEISPAIPAVLDEEGNEVAPAVEGVMGTRTVPVYQGIDTSFLVATLTAAIQELKAELDITKAKVAALEAA